MKESKRAQQREAEIERLRARVGELHHEVAQTGNAVDFLHRHGYRRCDIPACNCGSWHGGDAANRLADLREVLGSRMQGVTMLDAVKALVEADERAREVRAT